MAFAATHSSQGNQIQVAINASERQAFCTIRIEHINRKHSWTSILVKIVLFFPFYFLLLFLFLWKNAPSNVICNFMSSTRPSMSIYGGGRAWFLNVYIVRLYNSCIIYISMAKYFKFSEYKLDFCSISFRLNIFLPKNSSPVCFTFNLLEWFSNCYEYMYGNV